MKTFSLSIPTPCSEKWENFTPTEHGGFCSSCTKEVVDFTKMTDEQVIDFIKKRPSHLCGRLKQDQLRQYHQFDFSKVRPGYMFLKAGVLSLLLLLTSKPSPAGNSVVDPPKTAQESKLSTQLQLEQIAGGYVVRGVVISEEDGLPMPGVNVTIKGSLTGTVTDAEGRFELPGRLKEGSVIIFAFIGYESREYVVNQSTVEVLEIVLKMDVSMRGEVVITGMLGEVSATEVYQEDSKLKSFWSKFKSWF
jgi:hypothetical protein